MAADFEDDDVLSSQEEDDGSADEISDDSEDLLAAADGQSSEDVTGGSSEDDGQDPDGAAAPAETEQQAAAAASDKGRPASPDTGAQEHDMLLMSQATSDGTAVQLQVAELLKEVKATLSPSQASSLDDDLHRLRKVLQAISPHQVQGDCAAGFLRDLGLSPAAVSLPFQPPSVVAAVGSLPLGAALLHSGEVPGSLQPVTVDVAVVMPSSCFFRKAHLNYRYHALRALYLATICNHLAACPAFAARSLQLEALQQDPTRPVLLLGAPEAATATSSTPSYQLRIIPCCSPATFPLPRLAPDRNGVRWVRRRSPPAVPNATGAAPAATPPLSATAHGAAAPAGAQPEAKPTAGSQANGHAGTAGPGAAAEEAAFMATPTYNMGILADMMVLPHAVLLHKAARAVPAFADGCVLLKAWAVQHGLGCSGPAGSADGLDGHTLALLLAHLVEQGKLTAAMSPLQVLRCGLQALSGATPSAAASNLVKGICMSAMSPGALRDAALAAAPALLSPKFAAQHSTHAPPAMHHARTGPSHEQLEALLAATLGTEPATSPSDDHHGAGAAAATSPLAKVAPATAASVAKLRKAQPAVLLDPLGLCNSACRVSKAALGAAASAAKASLSLLNTPADAEASLAAVLLSPCRHATNYDYMWAIDVSPHPTYASTVIPHGATPRVDQSASAAGAQHTGSQPGAQPAGGSQAAGKGKKGKKAQQAMPAAAPAGQEAGGEEACQHWAHSCVGDVCAWREQETALESVIKAALTDRALLVRAIQRGVPRAPVTALSQGLLPVARPHEVLVGARVDPALATRLVDVGPAADDLKASARFRAFWGDMAELRRFQDGKISEAVVWGGPGAGLAMRHTIPDAIVQYAVRRHRPGGALGTLRSSAGALDPVLRREDDDNPDMPVLCERLLDAATDKLSKQLRALEGLALKVVAVQPLSAASRHTEVFPPLPHPLAGGVPPAELGQALAPGSRVPRVLQQQLLLCQLESSGRWPSDPVAFAKMKAALGLQLAQAVEANLGLTTQATEECVDVLYEGFAFRLQLYSGRDEAMLVERARALQQAKPTRPGAPSAPGPQGSGQAPAVPPESLPLIRSWHHGLISRLAGTNASFAPACRLAKRWVAAHCLSNHVAEEAVELLVAALYSSPGPRGPPGSRMAGFLRFLQLVSQHPWAARPLVVDPDASLDAATHRALQHRFNERRGQAGGALPALYITTPRDLTSSHWTREHPQPAVLSRMVSLARSCLAAATQLLDGSAKLQHSSHIGAAAANGIDMDSQESGDTAEQAAGRQQAHEAALLGALFTPQLQQYDMLLQLRTEALPRADCALPGWLAAGGDGRRKRSCRQPDALWGMVEAQMDRDVPPAKRARAFLDAFPDKAMQGRGPAALRQELLVGFEPLPHLTATLQQHLLGGHAGSAQQQQQQLTSSAGPGVEQHERPAHHALPLLATLCVDDLGGRLVGVKWAPAAFLPAPPKASTCHTSLPCVLTGLAARHSESAGMAAAGGPGCVPDVARVVSEVCELGQGVVQAVQIAHGCHNLPVGSVPSV